ncbi:hypothetical protein VZT92_017267 [Zoarces viviparus]|uniref:Uncharacterized protein n=1 Tax=Zoarces viviparus TaxID=48416 RepID=A0AAW1EUB8_ZOAVI
MRVSGLHSNLSAALCNITVNCSIRDEWVWSFCDGEGCRTSQRSLRKVNITIFTDNTSIVCSGNNHVSTSKVYESIEATSEACYENVDATQPCQTSSPTIRPREEPGSQRSQKVDTVYSVLPAVTSSLGKSERHETTQETWRSKYVPLEEEEHVDTLYSVLQLPRKATAPAIGQTEVVQKPKR